MYYSFMMSSKTIALTVMATLLFLTACQQQNTVVAITPDTVLAEKIAEEQRCANVICGQNEECEAGNCVCTQKYKSCNEKCIPTAGCCTQDDCDDNNFCGEDNTCHKKQQTCNYYEAWDIETEECTCAIGTKFCQAQNICIPQNHCCTPIDCTFRRDICVPTNYAAGICITNPSLHCKTIVEGNQARFTLGNESFVIAVTNIFEKGNTAMRINDKTTTLTFNTSETLNKNAAISVQHIKNLGGVCKKFND